MSTETGTPWPPPGVDWYYHDDWTCIACADCRDVLPKLPKVDLVLTDPPYGIYACGGKWGLKQDLQWDKQPAGNIDQVLSSCENAIIWGGQYFTLRPSRGWLVWYKRDAVRTASDAELAWTSIDMNTHLFDWPIAATNSQRIGHPTQKPLELMIWCLSFIPGSKTILDPFMGSGTTLRAAKDLGRRAIGIEIERKYCDIAVKRLQQECLPLSFTDQKPALVESSLLPFS